ncbi:SUMF1/EgtB/PvdO family nonheme iron enzyme [Akkermansiaceae bacterium]|nr:SUMF1/EgtB/PvdO family nonheme iron enzyme [Akkermansiaceae bacterium]
MNQFVRSLALPCLMLLPASALADDFTGFSMDFVDITGGLTADNTGYGAVGYNYRMGVNEVSRGMIDSYNANSGGPAITMFDYAAGGVSGGNLAGRPATGVSWNEAARFANWLNTSSGYSAAYQFSGPNANDNIALWTLGDAGYDPSNPFRNSQAYYFLPSEDEWYRAAYYDPNANGGAGGYWDYATGSNTAPTAVTGGATGAVYGQSSPTGPALVTDAGGLSPFGTMAQNGNVWEWGESGLTPPNDSALESRVIRGGVWSSSSSALASSFRTNSGPTVENSGLGFRVAAAGVPEPSGVLLTVLGAMGLLLKRRRS